MKHTQSTKGRKEARYSQGYDVHLRSLSHSSDTPLREEKERVEEQRGLEEWDTKLYDVQKLERGEGNSKEDRGK